MASESETVDALEAAALQLTPADRARLGDRLIGTIDAVPEGERPGQRKWSVGISKSKMELSLYFPVPKPSPN